MHSQPGALSGWQGVCTCVCEYVRLKETERGESAHVHLTLWGPSSSTYLSLLPAVPEWGLKHKAR